MNIEEFKQTLGHKSPPASLSPALRALWHAKNESWDRAHEIVQDESSRECAWVHAFLHRQEGDYGNACYWYSTAGKKAMSRDAALDVEWEQIAEALTSPTCSVET